MTISTEKWRLAWIIAHANYGSEEAAAGSFDAFCTTADQWMWRFRDGLKAFPSPHERDAILAEMAVRDYYELNEVLAIPRSAYGDVLRGASSHDVPAIAAPDRAASFAAREEERAAEARIWNAGVAALRAAQNKSP